MTNNPTNRISAILDEIAPTLSPLCAEGAIGSAPVTPDGRARAVKEPISDDMLARLITPPRDAREDDKLFGQFRGQLIAEFNPQTFSRIATIDSLAHDFVQLRRARSAVEPSTWRPYISKASAENLRELQEKRDNVRCIRSASEFVRGVGRACGHEQAMRVADLIGAWVTNLEAEVTPTADAPAEQEIPAVDERHREMVAEIEEYEKKLLQERQTEWESLRPFKKKLMDRDHLYYFFAGFSSVGRRERDQLHGLLQRVQENQEMVMDFRSRLAPRNDELQVQVEQRPAKELIVLQRQISDLEKNIERKLKILRKE